jgi:hypothetical protein
MFFPRLPHIHSRRLACPIRLIDRVRFQAREPACRQFRLEYLVEDLSTNCCIEMMELAPEQMYADSLFVRPGVVGAPAMLWLRYNDSVLVGHCGDIEAVSQPGRRR